MQVSKILNNSWLDVVVGFQSFKLPKKKLFVVIVCTFSFNSAFSQNQVVGKWLSDDKEAITEIYEQAGKYFGKITWLKKPNDDKGKPITDTENPDKSKRGQPLVGSVILKNLSYKTDEWSGGSIYDPESGKTYSCKIWLSYGKLKVRGYLGIFYETQVWTQTK